LGHAAETVFSHGHNLVIRGAGMAAGLIGQAMRAAGMERVSELEAHALLNPELFKLLTAKAVQDPKAPIMNRLLANIAAVGAQAASRVGK
jgi:hypothetical protein